jgi:hypothetical protein
MKSSSKIGLYSLLVLTGLGLSLLVIAAPPMNWIERPSGGNPEICLSCGGDPVIMELDFRNLLDELEFQEREIRRRYDSGFMRPRAQDFLCEPPYNPEGEGLGLPEEPKPSRSLPDWAACFQPNFKNEGFEWDNELSDGDWTIRFTCQIANSCAQLKSIEWHHAKVNSKCPTSNAENCSILHPGLVKSKKFETEITSSFTSSPFGSLEPTILYKYVHPTKYSEKKLAVPGAANTKVCNESCPTCKNSPPLYDKIERDFLDQLIGPSNALQTKIQTDFFWYWSLGCDSDSRVWSGSFMQIPVCVSKEGGEYLSTVDVCDQNFGQIETAEFTLDYGFNKIFEYTSLAPGPPVQVCMPATHPLSIDLRSKYLFTPGLRPTMLYSINFLLQPNRYKDPCELRRRIPDIKE